MKKYLILIIGCILAFNTQTKATDYAILISAGKTTVDDLNGDSEYWYDLCLAYKDLIRKEGYTHDRIIVFYGDGNNFVSNDSTYQVPASWGDIVDFDNNPTTMSTQFAALGNNTITINDNLHIRWVFGHGMASTPDNYQALIQNRGVWMTKAQIVDMIDLIRGFNRRKIMWTTCFSGCLANNNNLSNNGNTSIVTSSNWDEASYGYFLPNETVHAEFNYVATSALYGKDPLGTTYSGDSNDDNVVSMWEVWNKAYTSPIMSSVPQLSNTSLAEKIYIDEGLQLTNITFPNSITYWVDNFQTNNVVFPSTSTVIIDIDQGFNAIGTFTAPLGATFKITP